MAAPKLRTNLAFAEAALAEAAENAVALAERRVSIEANGMPPAVWQAWKPG